MPLQPRQQTSSQKEAEDKIKELSDAISGYLKNNEKEKLKKIFDYLFGDEEKDKGVKISHSQARKILDLFRDLKERATEGENDFRDGLIKILIFFEYQMKREAYGKEKHPTKELIFIKALREATKQILNDLSKSGNVQLNIREISERYNMLAEMFVVANYKKGRS